MTQLRAIKSFYDNQLGLVTLEDDVLGIVSQVREISDGKIIIDLDPDTGAYHLVEHCEDGAQRLVFSVSELDGRVVERLLKADSQSRHHEDPYDAVEAEQDALQAAIDAKKTEEILEHGEQLIFELQKAGQAPFLEKKVYIPRGIDA